MPASTPESPKLMEPAEAGAVLIRSLEKTLPAGKPITVADASVASGLATRDTEAGLTWLTSEYRGHLRVTEDGDLVHLFPTGFTKPWVQKEAFDRFLAKAGSTLVAAGRFIVRAWLLIAMVSYALLFVALLIGLAFARQGSNDRDSSPGLSVLGGLFRMIGDAFFWTFHPFSPVYIGSPYYGDAYGYGYGAQEMQRRRRDEEDEEEKVPFYERVNRFVFGPPTPKEDPNEARARILREIRAQKGRITLADVMRVTGLPRAEADPLMARLMLDHEGEVDVSESGGIFYTFEALRRTASEQPERDANAGFGTHGKERAAWERIAPLPPLTGNTTGANIGVALLNGFNLLASSWVISQGLTISNIMTLLFADRHHRPPILPDDGVPIALGVVPLVFSIVLFVLPMIRAAFRAREKKQHRLERARLEVLREAVTHASKKETVDDRTLRTIVRVATGEEPTSKEITKRVVELGGDVDLDPGPNGEIRYRCPELEADLEAADEEREHASEKEARLGQVVFASDQ